LVDQDAALPQVDPTGPRPDVNSVSAFVRMYSANHDVELTPAGIEDLLRSRRRRTIGSPHRSGGRRVHRSARWRSATSRAAARKCYSHDAVANGLRDLLQDMYGDRLAALAPTRQLQLRAVLAGRRGGIDT
jgi:hypothetical protein